MIRNEVGKTSRGIEIGASYAPILPKRDGFNTLVIDHTDTQSLRLKYNNIGVDTSRLETVDAIDDGGEFSELDLTGEGFDFIVASHVFEHLTDPIHFLQRCERALKPDGKVYLLVPDRRYTFDYLRPSTTAGHMLAAYLAEQKRHGTAVLFDHHASNATRGGVQVWMEGHKGDFAFAGTPSAGYASATSTNDEYVDCHAWVFTPSSFRLAMQDLHSAGVLGFKEELFHPSFGCEFFVVLSRNTPVTAQPDRLTLALNAIKEAGPEEPLSAAMTGPQVDIAPGYESAAPSGQNAIDIFKDGWVSAFPSEKGLQAGTKSLFADPRILWLTTQLNGWFKGKDVLELGPLEGAHTATLLSEGAASVTAVEAKRDAYLRCLVTKEVLQLRDASFHLGNFLPYLEAEERQWPLIVASGVLYHMSDPVLTLELLSSHTDRLYLWTHVVDPDAMRPGDPRLAALGEPEMRDWNGRLIKLYKRPYLEQKEKTFCGGMEAEPRWIDRESLLWLLNQLGFDEIIIGHDSPDAEHGPSLSILALRSKSSQPQPENK
ncbi:methyltransferase domain-containing protein [Ochrobactrum vermis]|uniref:Methyltransferase domain-containing protein n=1 Tax=Ochrobactrum vermis TaxID=1827297 RepID=A0ABU8P9Z3_9HYPH|nr:methyltransferase domain-containing protein [Ochrobactrum vermis]